MAAMLFLFSSMAAAKKRLASSRRLRRWRWMPQVLRAREKWIPMAVVSWTFRSRMRDSEMGVLHHECPDAVPLGVGVVELGVGDGRQVEGVGWLEGECVDRVGGDEVVRLEVVAEARMQVIELVGVAEGDHLLEDDVVAERIAEVLDAEGGPAGVVGAFVVALVDVPGEEAGVDGDHLLVASLLGEQAHGEHEQGVVVTDEGLGAGWQVDQRAGEVADEWACSGRRWWGSCGWPARRRRRRG